MLSVIFIALATAACAKQVTVHSCASITNATLDAVRDFKTVYSNRPFLSNHGGSRFDNSFGLWSLLRTFQPKYVIESGAFQGHSTWTIRETLPEAKIFTIDPDCPRRMFPNVTYFCGDNYTDFNDITWETLVDPMDTFLYFDDHQSSIRRLFQGITHGFSRFLFEDNYDVGSGDHQSIRRVLDIFEDGNDMLYLDNFAHRKNRINARTQLVLRKMLLAATRYMCEFPPIFSARLSSQKRFKQERLKAAPIVESGTVTFQEIAAGFEHDEFEEYTYMVYIKV